MKKPNEAHFLGNINQKALIQRDGRILLVQYTENFAAHSDKRAWGKWDMPGGRLNIGESVLSGLKREVSEEIDAEISVEKIVAVGTYVSFKKVPVFFVVYKASLVDEDRPFVFQDGEVAAARWVNPQEFFELPIIYPEYQEALKSVLM